MVYLILGAGFEEAEAIVPCDLLRRAGVEVRLAGIGGTDIPGGHGIPVHADCAAEAAELTKADMLILPGGLGGVRSIRGCEPVLCAAREMAQAPENGSPRPSAPRPTVLAELGLLEGRRATCYPGMEPEMCGAVMQNAGVVRDGNFITGRAAGSAFAFGLALVEALCGAEETAARIAAQVVWNGGRRHPMTEEHRSDGRSIDEILAEARAELDKTPDEPQQAAEPGTPEPDDFTPDFGHTFDDYGEFEEPQPEEELPPEPPRKRHKRIVPLFVKIILYVVIVAVVSVGAGYAAWACATGICWPSAARAIPFRSPCRRMRRSTPLPTCCTDNGLIQYPWPFKLYCKFTHSAGRMDAGTYELAYNYDYHALVSGMTETGGTRTTVRVMLPEGATCAQIFALLEKNEVCTAEKLGESAANTHFDYWFLKDIPYGETNRLEGFLFPDTYDFYVNDDPDRVLEKLLSNFNRKFSDDASAQLETLNTALAERWTAKGYDESYIEAHRMTIYDLVTVASMIEKETASAKESSTIASVIYNRLCDPANYPYLNVDATIVYALGGVDGALTYEDTQIDSPYNTYNRTGLPAGPISNPGLSSISAALNPADTSYYYYALDDSTGLHHFSESYDEHQAFLSEQSNG